MLKTHNPKELSVLNKNLICSFKPGTLPVLDKTNYEVLDFAAETIVRKYKNHVKFTRRRVNDTLLPIYRETIPFSERIISQVASKIQYIIEETGADFGEIAVSLREVLGQNFRFFKWKNMRRVPITSDKILEAYKALQNNQTSAKIKSILYS